MLQELQNTRLSTFKTRVDELIGTHPIVTSNSFTSWFSQGCASPEQLRAFTVQFSVFSHLFIEAQLRKCINASDRASYRAGKEILMNELGVMFTKDGSIDNGRFRFTAAHFEWLADFASHLGLTFGQIGKRKHGSQATLAFCDALMTWYGSDDESTAAGASHAIEHWAAAGFWKELIAGLKVIKAGQIADLPLAFWVFHDQIEDQHAAHTDDELASAFAKSDFDEEAFLQGGKAMLDAVAIFWNGLNAERQLLEQELIAASATKTAKPMHGKSFAREIGSVQLLESGSIGSSNSSNAHQELTYVRSLKQAV